MRKQSFTFFFVNVLKVKNSCCGTPNCTSCYLYLEVYHTSAYISRHLFSFIKTPFPHCPSCSSRTHLPPPTTIHLPPEGSRLRLKTPQWDRLRCLSSERSARMYFSICHIINGGFSKALKKSCSSLF